MSRIVTSLFLCGLVLAFGLGHYLIGADDKPSKTAPKNRVEESEKTDDSAPDEASPRKPKAPVDMDSDDDVLKEEAILEALAQPVSVEFDGTPLSEALATLKSRIKVDVWVDKAAINDEGVALDQPVNLQVKNIRAESVLKLILLPIELDWLVQDEVLKITTREKAADALETRVYSIGGLFDAGHTPDNLVDAIMSCVSPATWDETGGQGSLRALPNTLVVRQSQRVHAEVELFLSDLLTVVDDEEAQGKRAGREMIALKVYHTGTHSAEKLAESLKKLVEPQSWEAEGGQGSIHAVDGALLVKQTARIHGELERILRDLNPPRLRGHLTAVSHHHHEEEGEGKAEDGGRKADEKSLDKK